VKALHSRGGALTFGTRSVFVGGGALRFEEPPGMLIGGTMTGGTSVVRRRPLPPDGRVLFGGASMYGRRLSGGGML
jgi:hypothetical protein